MSECVQVAAKTTLDATSYASGYAYFPAEGQDDATAVKVITSVYQGGLENLKKITE